MEKNKNLLITIVLCGLIFFAWQFLFELPRERALQQQQAAQQASQALESPAGNAPASAAPGVAAPGTAAPAQPAMTRDQALAASPRVAIDTPRLKGSIALKGGRLDDLVLKDYHDTADPKSPNVVLLTPSTAPEGYFSEVGFTATDTNLKLPTADTLWQAEGGPLSPDHPVALTWDNGAGLVFKREFAVDSSYLFTITQSVENKGSAPVSLIPYSRVVHFGLPADFATSGTLLFEGLIGALDGTLRQEKFKDIRSQADNTADPTIHYETQGGWLGVTDKYWLVAQFIPNDVKASARFAYSPKLDSYQSDFTAAAINAAPGASASFKSSVFAGAKEVHILADYRDRLGVPLLDRAIDFGFFWIISKPLFLVLDWIYGGLKLLLGSFGNFGIAILCLTVLVRLCLFPLANKSYASMSKMKTLQPKMAELKEKYGDDKQRLNTEMMALYKREKVNPAAGCLPILIQFPVFLALYKVLSVTIEMRHAPFYGWIHDLSAPDPTTFLNLFGLIPWNPADYIHLPLIGQIIGFVSIGVWPLVMGVTMWLQMRLNPTSPDPVQARMFALMPFIFTFMLAHNTVGLVIYWAWNNTLSILQQRFIMWKMNKASQAKELKKA